MASLLATVVRIKNPSQKWLGFFIALVFYINLDLSI